MPRYALKIEYDGLPYCGWQRQTSLPTVQGAIEDALAKLEPREHAIVAAGRTDTGVHATGQVAHCDMEKDWGTFRLSEALNYHLKPAPVAITACVRVDDDWHARFSAIERRYLFRLGAMTSQHFARRSVRQTARCAQLDVLDIEQVDRRDGAQEFNFHVRARSFLHNQVRSFVGTLERVGAGSWTPDDVTAALEAKDRNRCGPVCPPQGLIPRRSGLPRRPVRLVVIG
ncbi:tRNA pseudouridine synthase A [Nymphon striatum]|nr:tRNA pseudouridine synthase A [Nymphon striatum]